MKTIKDFEHLEVQIFFFKDKTDRILQSGTGTTVSMSSPASIGLEKQINCLLTLDRPDCHFASNISDLYSSVNQKYKENYISFHFCIKRNKIFKLKKQKNEINAKKNQTFYLLFTFSFSLLHSFFLHSNRIK